MHPLSTWTEEVHFKEETRLKEEKATLSCSKCYELWDVGAWFTATFSDESAFQ